MKKFYTFRRTLSVLPLFLLLGIFVASCSKDDPETSNLETDNTEETTPDEDYPIPEGAHVWEYYSINKDGESVTVTSELPQSPYFNDSKIYEIVYIPSTVSINGKKYRVTSIGKDAFYNCTSLTSISIPQSVTSIGDYAFMGCSSLTSISIPEGVTNIGGGVFYYCPSLTSITVVENNPVYDSRKGCNAIIKTSSNTLIAGCPNTTIPEEVTSIGNSAFEGCMSLTSIDIPNSVTSIGDYAFAFCTSLISIEIPESVTTIGEGVFYYSRALTSIFIPESATSIGEYAFTSCQSLTSITVAAGNPVYDSREGCNAIVETASNTLIIGCQNTIIPNSVTSIGTNAFSYCYDLTSISIPESVTSIGNNAFKYCSKLTSISIPNSVTSIGYDAFMDCNAVTSISIPDGVTSIESGVFWACYALTSISIPKNVTNIGSDAFCWCKSLTSVTCLAEEVPSLGNYVFDDVPLDEATLYVPASALEKYKVADQWKDFSKILPIE